MLGILVPLVRIVAKLVILAFILLALASFIETFILDRHFNAVTRDWIMTGAPAFIIAIFLLTILRRVPESEVIKHRPDTLADEDTIEQVQTALADSTGVWCGQLEGQDLYTSLEDRGVVIGPPGTGKTAFLVSQLLRWADSGRPFVCLDIKPEIEGITQAALADKGYKLYRFNPTANTGERYNPLADLEGPEAVTELAGALIPSEDPRNKVFSESARDFLDALITHLQVDGTPTLPRLRALLAEADSWRELLQVLLKSPDPDARELANGLAMLSSSERLLGSIFAAFRSNLRFLRLPTIRQSLDASDFSLADLTSGEPVGLFLQFEEQHRETTARLLAAMVGHIMRYLITHKERPPVLLLLDEIGNAPIVSGLIEKLNTIRSRHLPTWMYWQSLEQMQKYGDKANEGPNTILGACDFQMVFRLNDNTSAEWMSKRIGVVDRLVESDSVTYGQTESVTQSQSLVLEPTIFPHELQALKFGEAICVYRGLAWRGEATPYYELYPELKVQRKQAS